MMRDAVKDKAWFDQWIAYDIERLKKMAVVKAQSEGDRGYEPQYVFEIGSKNLYLLLRRYSRGDAIGELSQYFSPLLDAWEEAERLGQAVWSPEIQVSRHSWKVNFDHYIDCFWLVGLALALEIGDTNWQRLLTLIDLGENEGTDELLDRVIARRQPGRRIGKGLCYPRPYQHLLDAVNAPAPQQPALLKAFVKHWYKELDRLPKKGLSRDTAMYERPYWYAYHDVEGAYFGYWCIEAVAAVKAFDLDDTTCLGLPHYPGDLLRLNAPITHLRPINQIQAKAKIGIAPPETMADKLRRWAYAPKP